MSFCCSGAQSPVGHVAFRWLNFDLLIEPNTPNTTAPATPTPPETYAAVRNPLRDFGGSTTTGAGAARTGDGGGLRSRVTERSSPAASVTCSVLSVPSAAWAASA